MYVNMPYMECLGMVSGTRLFCSVGLSSILYSHMQHLRFSCRCLVGGELLKLLVGCFCCGLCVLVVLGADQRLAAVDQFTLRWLPEGRRSTSLRLCLDGSEIEHLPIQLREPHSAQR